MFYDSYLKVCEQKGVAPTSLLTELGISKGALSGWKAGAEPSNRTKKQIADGLEITVEELVSGQIKNPDANKDTGLSEQDIKLMDLIKRLPLDKREMIESLAIMLDNAK